MNRKNINAYEYDIECCKTGCYAYSSCFNDVIIYLREKSVSMNDEYTQTQFVDNYISVRILLFTSLYLCLSYLHYPKSTIFYKMCHKLEGLNRVYLEWYVNLI